MPSSCSGLRQQLADCLLKSDCVQKYGNAPTDCLKNHFDELPKDCQNLRFAYYNCRKGILDMRKRFRGNNPGEKLVDSNEESKD